MSSKRSGFKTCKSTLGMRVWGFVYDEFYDGEMWGLFIHGHGIAYVRYWQ